MSSESQNIQEYAEYLKLKTQEFKANGDWLRDLHRSAVAENKAISARQKQGKKADVEELLRAVDASIAERRARGEVIDPKLVRTSRLNANGACNLKLRKVKTIKCLYC